MAVWLKEDELMRELLKNKTTRSRFKRMLAMILVLIITLTSVNLNSFMKAKAATEYKTLYFIDNTAEQWVKNDSAVMELVDNTNGHDSYWMTQKDDVTWCVNVPESAYNITFNRYSSDKTTQWNSWSAGGRDENNAYYADGAEYGHWEVVEEGENYFHAGDIIYLDLSEFPEWENDDALMYVNFTDASKEENGGNDITISNADKNVYNPKLTNVQLTDSVYAYVVTYEDEGASELRFWRGNELTLWNYSVALSYEDYSNGKNCIKVTGWNDSGSLEISEYSIDFNLDSDGDELTDYYEIIFGSSNKSVDSDNDKLSDYEEVAIIGTNPTSIDTDNDGILDGNEDADIDNLKNAEECQYGTNNCTIDSDADGLSDYDEIKIYGTNPLSSDTDGDGAGDYWEIKNEFDAKLYNEIFKIKQMEIGENTSIEIDLTSTGENIESFSVLTHINDNLFINKLIPGYIGSGYDFEIDGEFEQASIKYYFDESFLEEENFKPVIYYYNEEIHELEEIETQWDGESNYVTAELPHFSTYLLLNKTKFDEVWEKEIKPPYLEGEEDVNLNIVFAVDLSGSMRGTKLSTTKTAIKSFINILDENDRAALVTFTSSATIVSDLTAEKDKLIEAVDSMSAYGLTSIYEGLEESVDILDKNNLSGYNMIIVFTDGYDEPATTYDTHYKKIVEKAKENNIVVHTIGISTVDEALLNKIAQTTGGNYYYASVVSELQDKIDSIKQETEDYTTDSNNDGISDYYTKLLCDGTLKITTESVITKWIGNYEKVQANADYDGDGLLNGEEIKIKNRNGRITAELVSDPTDEDIDGDDINDYDELSKGTNPFKYDVPAMHVDYLFNNDIYLASVLSEDYLTNPWLKTQVGAGNLLMNWKLSHTNDYKKSLLNFIEIHNEASYEETKLDFMIQMYESDLCEFLIELADYALILNDIGDLSSDYVEAKELLISTQGRIESLKKTLEAVKDYADIVGYDDEMRETYDNIFDQFLEQKLANTVASEAIKKSKLEGRLADRVGNYVRAISPKVKEKLKKAGKCFTYGIFAIDVGTNTLETLELYAALDVGYTQYVELEELFSAISIYSDNEELKSAAIDVKYAISDDFSKCISEMGTIMGDIGESGLELAYLLTISKVGTVGLALSAGWSIGDMIFNTGTINEELLKVIAYGDVAVAYSESLEDAIRYDCSPYYYICDESMLTELQILGQLRVVGEDKYAETSNERSFLIKWLGSLVECSQKDIEELCEDTIDEVIRRCDILKIVVSKKFKDCYF